MRYEVKLTLQAEEDLLRLFEQDLRKSPVRPEGDTGRRCVSPIDFVLARELERDGDLTLAERALTAITHGLATLRSSPWTCRKAAQSPFLRELVIPYGHTGYVALFEITDSTTVVVAAVRHQREDDYH